MSFNWINKGTEILAEIAELDAGFMLVLVSLCALATGVMALYVAILALKR